MTGIYKFAHIFLSICFFVLFTNITVAQEVKLKDTTINYKSEEHTAIYTSIEPNAKTIKKAWQDFLKDTYDVKIKGIGFLVNKDVLNGEEVTFSGLPIKNINLFTKVVEEGEISNVSIFAFDKRGDFLNAELYPEMYEGLKEVFNAFLDSFLPTYYREQVNEAQENVNNLKDDISDLEENIDDNQDKISDNRKEIEKLLEEIDDMESQVEDKSKLLKEMKSKLIKEEQKLKRVRTSIQS